MTQSKDDDALDCPYHAAGELLTAIPTMSLTGLSKEERALRIGDFLHDLADLTAVNPDPALLYALETLLLVSTRIQVRPKKLEEKIPSLFGVIKPGAA